MTVTDAADRWTIGLAEPADAGAIRNLLAASGLPNVDVQGHLGHFLVARAKGLVVGAAGLEVYGSDALLRSLVVDPRLRGKGLGHALVRAAVALALRESVKRLYLLTTTAAEFFSRIGFEPHPREQVPAAIGSTKEFTELCSSSSTCLSALVSGIHA